MKTKNYVHSLCFVVFLCPFVSTPSFGQASYIKNRWTIKTGFARNNSGITGVPEGVFAGNLRAECSYGISNFIEAGAYLGYSIIDVYTNMIFNSSGFRTSASVEGYSMPSYGIGVNFQVLPLFIKKDDFRFDYYITARYGGNYITSPKDYYWHGAYSEYGIGNGFAFYPLPHVGIYIEYSFGKYHLNKEIEPKENSKLRYGLIFKF